MHDEDYSEWANPDYRRARVRASRKQKLEELHNTLREQLAQVSQELLTMASYPDEPKSLRGEPNAVCIRVTYPGLRDYDYMALNIDNGVWVVYGKSYHRNDAVPKFLTWEELMTRFTPDEAVAVKIWVVDGMTQIWDSEEIG